MEVEVGEEEDDGVCAGEGLGVSTKDSMEGVLVARNRVRRLCWMRKNKERRRKMRTRSVKPRMYPIFDVEDRCCQNAWKSVVCVAAVMGIGDALRRGVLGIPVRTVFRVDEVTGIGCWEVEVENDVEDNVIGSVLRVDI